MPDKLNIRDLSEQYGFAYAMLRSNDELYNLFRRAVNQTWDQTRIMAAVRSTNWYKRNSESERNFQALRASDPATFQQQMQAQRTRVSMLATEYGARIGRHKINDLAIHALSDGWDDNQLRRVLGRYVQYSDGRLLGQAGAMESEWRQYAASMGVGVGKNQLRDWASGAVSGRITPQDVLSRIRETAISKYEGFADRLRQGETVESIAEPYRQAMAEILEINPQDVNISKDRTIQMALQMKNEAGKPEPMRLWQFEDRLRQDPRWQQTNNARDQVMSMGNKVLQDFGLAT